MFPCISYLLILSRSFAAYASVISVGAFECTGKIAPFSTQNDQVEIAGPGAATLSTVVPTIEDVPKLTVHLHGGTPMQIKASAVTGSELGIVTAPLADCQNGTAVCIDARGKICLVARSVGPDYSCRLNNAIEGGCVAMIITNSWDPPCSPLDFRTVYGNCTAKENAKFLLSATTSQYDGDQLRSMMKNGAKATLSVSKGQDPTFTLMLSGTSMAAPHVTGVTARIWADFPRCNNTDVRLALQQGAKQVGTDGKNNAYGYGLVQAVSSRNILAARPCATPIS